MMQYFYSARVGALVLAAALVTSCDEEPVGSYVGTAPPESTPVEVQLVEPGASCARYYYYQPSDDRKGDERYCPQVIR